MSSVCICIVSLSSLLILSILHSVIDDFQARYLEMLEVFLP